MNTSVEGFWRAHHREPQLSINKTTMCAEYDETFFNNYKKTTAECRFRECVFAKEIILVSCKI